MGFLNGLAWLVFGGMGVKDAYDNKKYVDASKNRMVATDRLFYCDSKGRMFYGATGEEIMQTYRDGRKVYINIHNRRIVHDLTSEDYKRHIEESSKKFRHIKIKPDRGTEYCDYDLEERRFYRLDMDFNTELVDNKQVPIVKHYKMYYTEDCDHKLILEPERFEITEEEFNELGGRMAWGKR